MATPQNTTHLPTRRINYPFKPTLVRKVIYIDHKGKQRGYHVGEHRHLHRICELIYVDYGSIKLKTGDVELTLNPGDSVLIPTKCYHDFTGDGSTPYDFLNVLYVGAIPEGLANIRLPNMRENRDLLLRLKQESEERLPKFEEYAACCLTQLLINFSRRHNMSTSGEDKLQPDTHRHYRNEAVNRAMTIIDQEYEFPLCMADLSQAAGVSESYLRALLREETGESFTSLLQKRRVEAAKQLLRQSHYSLQEIATAVGYRSMPTFHTTFKRWVGMTPMAYSRSLGEPPSLQG